MDNYHNPFIISYIILVFFLIPFYLFKLMQICITLNIQLNSTFLAITALFNPTDWISQNAVITSGYMCGTFGYLVAICSLVYFAVAFTLPLFFCTFCKTLVWLLVAIVLNRRRSTSTDAVLGECGAAQTFDASAAAVVAGAFVGVGALRVAQCVAAGAFRTVSLVAVAVALRHGRAALAR